MAARVLFAGAYRPADVVEALLHPHNHPGHASQKSHGRKGNTVPSEGPVDTPIMRPGVGHYEPGQTYLRVQSANRDLTDLLDPEHVSYSWDSEDVFDRGTSTAETPEELAEYLAQTGIPIGLGDWVIVEVAGNDLGPGRDRHLNERLVDVDQIVSVRPLDDEFFGMIGDAYERLNEGA